MLTSLYVRVLLFEVLRMKRLPDFKPDWSQLACYEYLNIGSTFQQTVKIKIYNN